jgi:hypothetical protein
MERRDLKIKFDNNELKSNFIFNFTAFLDLESNKRAALKNVQQQNQRKIINKLNPYYAMWQIFQ